MKVRFTLDRCGVATTDSRVVDLIDSTLRGISQVMLQNNAYSGLIFLFGLFVSSTRYGTAAIVGALLGTLFAKLLGVDHTLIRSGLSGFNGTLVGIALAAFVNASAVSWFYFIILIAWTTVLMAALADLLATRDIPTLTAPFVLVTWAFLLATYQFTRVEATTSLPLPILPEPVTLPGTVTSATYFEGFLKGVAEVFLQDDLLAGAIFLVALLVSSRISCIAAAAGSFFGLLTAVALGAAEPSIRLGLHGFNPVLTAIALAGTFYVLDWKSALYALLGVIVTAIVYESLTVALKPLGIPTLTGPFVVVTWLFLLARTSFPTLRPISPGHASTPEVNLMAGTRGGSGSRAHHVPSARSGAGFGDQHDLRGREEDSR